MHCGLLFEHQNVNCFSRIQVSKLQLRLYKLLTELKAKKNQELQDKKPPYYKHVKVHPRNDNFYIFVFLDSFLFPQTEKLHLGLDWLAAIDCVHISLIFLPVL